MVCAVALSAAVVLALLTRAQDSSATAAPSGQRSPVILAQGVAVRALALDSRGNIYISTAAAPNRIFTLTGVAALASKPGSASSTTRLAVVAGTGTAGSLGDGGNGLDAQFNLALNSLLSRSGIAIAADGSLFIADSLNSTIRRIGGPDSSEPGIVRSVAGRWAPKQSVTLSDPLGVAIDRAGTLYIADHTAGTISVLPFATDASAQSYSLSVLAHVASPASIALTVDGRTLFVASPESGSVFSINTQTREIRPVPGLAPQTNASHDASACATNATASTDSTSICPAGIAVDGAGNLFVADANSGRILRVDAQSSAVTTLASGLKSPGEMAFDARGNLYVAEQGAQQVIEFEDVGQDPSNLTITAPAALPPPPSPRVCPATAPFNFCDQPTGGSTPTQAFTITNNSSAAVSGLTISFTGANPSDFQTAGNNCGTSLNAGATCTVSVDFAPTTTGARAASLSVTDSQGDSATSDVTGTGDDYQLALNGSPQEQSVIQGGVVTFNFNIVPDSVFGGDVTIVCPSNIPSLSTCTQNPATVTVTPGTTATFSITIATTYNGIMGSSGAFAPLSVTGGTNNLSAGGEGISNASLATISFLVLIIILGLLLLSKRRTALRPVLWTLMLLSVCAAGLLAGCKRHSVPATLNTPAGITNLVIQGGAQNAGRGTTVILDVVAR